MKVNIMPCRFPINSQQWPYLMQCGVEKHGDSVRVSMRPDNSDCHIFWGLKRRHGMQALGLKKTCLIIERAYLNNELGDRFKWAALGFNGLNGLADFKNENVPPDRWEKYFKHTVKPWRGGGDYALVIGQLPGDASLYGMDAYKWAQKTIIEAKKIYKNVMFRPHPSHKQPKALEGADFQKGTLEDALKGAKVVITYSSNAAVDAVMNGIPAVSFHPGSMAYEVTTHSLNEPLITPDLNDWGRKIAYAQWLPSELKDGTAWAHFRKHIKC